MLAVPVDKPFDDKDWVFEVKWDGVRGIYIRDKPAKIQGLQTRKGSTISHRYPEIIKDSDVVIQCENSIVLDGELVVLNEEGQPDFQRHQQRMNVDHPREIERLSKEIPATYFVFDILFLNGRKLENLDFIERRKILANVIRTGSRRIRISEFIEHDGIALFKHTADMGLEGIVAKYKYGKYLQGIRSDNWLKIKSILTQDCVVIGYTPGEGNREDYFGSLILATYREGKLRFVGHSGSGFGFDQLASLYEKLQKLTVKDCPVDSILYVNRTPSWVIPELVVEVKFNGWTQDKIMRAPIFLRLRDDKPPFECVIETSREVKSTVEHVEATSPESVKVSLTNPEKVFWPATKEHRALTKRDLVDYYDKVSKFILPHLRDRPISMSRYPDGISGKSFYQKDWNQETPDYVKTVEVFSETKNDIIHYVVCNNKETLLWLANLGCIEMHPWYSQILDYEACTAQARKDKIDSGPAPLDEDICGLDTSDFIVFDLDPYIYSGNEKEGQEPEYNLRGFQAAVQVASNLKELLDELGIEGFVKTSGKTGLHVFIPLSPDYSYDQTRNFAHIIGKILMKQYPELITMDWNTSKRKDKVFFDYNQNAKGKTITSALSLRPNESATVSMPMTWSELSEVVPTDFTIETVPVRLKKYGDPWQEILQERQDIASLLERVSSMSL
jgi:bifunctional non-homologous end joining protein LigD